MARELRSEYPGAICHLMFRGNGGRPIFGDDDNRKIIFENYSNFVSVTDKHSDCERPAKSK